MNELPPKNTTPSNCVHIGPGTNSIDNKENKKIDNKTKAKWSLVVMTIDSPRIRLVAII
jgi:hypothetical protein